jgi:hypothetical protein
VPGKIDHGCRVARIGKDDQKLHEAILSTRIVKLTHYPRARVSISSRAVFAHLPSTDGHSDMFVMERDGSDAHLLAATHLWENSPNWGRSPGE